MKYLLRVSYVACMVFLVLLFTLNYFFAPTGYDINLKVCKEYYEQELNGKIVEAYINRNNKAIFTYHIRHGKDTLIIANESNYVENLETFLEAGDSLFKPSNSFNNYIFKQSDKDKMIFKRGVDCVCGDSIPPGCEEKIKLLKKR
ncbi:MAG: hypothetical protein H7Y04_05375 [Verrucomicrobia bacterium]|nr:hypothetical protein [Cytophagales bacterium]